MEGPLSPLIAMANIIELCGLESYNKSKASKIKQNKKKQLSLVFLSTTISKD